MNAIQTTANSALEKGPKLMERAGTRSWTMSWSGFQSLPLPR
jgi:hypothetical protein